MSTLTEVINSILTDYLLTGQREPRNVLNSAPDSDDTTFTLLYDLKGAQEGARLSVDFEDVYVVGVEPTSKVVTVIRGDAGSTAASHTSGTTVWVNPKWSKSQVLRAINSELEALSGAGFFQMATVDLTFNSQVRGYDLTGVTPDDVIAIYEIMADYPGPANAPVPITSYRVIREAQTGDFASGIGIILNEPGHPGHTMRVSYKKRFTQVTSASAATDLSTSAGVDREAHDIIALGAAIRLAAGQEVRRSQISAQPDTRRAEDIPPGAVLQSVNGLVKVYERRVREEKARLARRYPPRKVSVNG